MHPSVLLLLAPLVSALMPEPVSPKLNILSPRAAAECDYNGCRCDTSQPRKPQGQFCGGCHWENGDYVITKKRINSHVYECNKSGGCCDYGYAKDCARQDGTGRCGGD